MPRIESNVKINGATNKRGSLITREKQRLIPTYTNEKNMI